LVSASVWFSLSGSFELLDPDTDADAVSSGLIELGRAFINSSVMGY
jgi:hypothetical protein